MTRRLPLRLFLPSLAAVGVSAAFGACGGEPQIDVGRDEDEDVADAGGGSGVDSDSDLDGGDADLSDADSDRDSARDEGGSHGGPVCEQASSEAELQPIYLAFVFDVSGSMGQMDRPQWWHDKSKKWDPVVEATTAFLEDEESQGVSASLVFFPSGNQDSIRCDEDSYESPIVSMRELPSGAFQGAFDDYIEEDAWWGSTPTRPALIGAGEYLRGVRSGNGALEAKYAIVLVTDGVPSGCGSTVGSTQEIAEELLDDGIPTYVIGVLNPTTKPTQLPTEWNGSVWSDWGTDPRYVCFAGTAPCDAPNALDDLDDIAESGGSQEAVLVETTDTNQAKEDLKAAIDAIRAAQISCNVGIPPNPQGGSFDKDRINVSVTVGAVKTDFAYDPDCEDAGSWHYDDAEDPSEIVLCDETCEEVRTLPGAQLNVDFLCEDRPDVVN